MWKPCEREEEKQIDGIGNKFLYDIFLSIFVLFHNIWNIIWKHNSYSKHTPNHKQEKLMKLFAIAKALAIAWE